MKTRFVLRPYADRTGRLHERWSDEDECTKCGQWALCEAYVEERFGKSGEPGDHSFEWQFVDYHWLCKDCRPSSAERRHACSDIECGTNGRTCTSLTDSALLGAMLVRAAS